MRDRGCVKRKKNIANSTRTPPPSAAAIASTTPSRSGAPLRRPRSGDAWKRRQVGHGRKTRPRHVRHRRHAAGRSSAKGQRHSGTRLLTTRRRHALATAYAPEILQLQSHLRGTFAHTFAWESPYVAPIEDRKYRSYRRCPGESPRHKTPAQKWKWSRRQPNGATSAAAGIRHLHPDRDDTQVQSEVITARYRWNKVNC